jgi:hypothetical protein
MHIPLQQSRVHIVPFALDFNLFPDCQSQVSPSLGVPEPGQ